MRKVHTIELGFERSLHVEEDGDGAAVVLVHGALATHVDWPPAFKAWLAQRSRMIAIDRPGHGLSQRPRFKAAPREQAAQVRAALAVLGVERAHFVGHSFGALVALAHAELFPDATQSLLLVSPICFPEWRPVEHTVLAPRALPVSGPFVSAVSNVADPAFLRTVHRLMFWPQAVPPEWERAYPFEQILRPEQMTREGEDAFAVSPLLPDGWLRLGAIRAPMRIIVGDRDLIADPNRQGRRLARGAPNASVLTLPGIGHMAHHCAEPQLRSAMIGMLDLESA